MNSAILLKKIQNKQISLAIIGLGYVGLPLAVTFASSGVHVTGFDVSKEKVTSINRGENYIADVDEIELQKNVTNGQLKATTDFRELSTCDAIIICVPTPLDHFKKPDMKFIESSIRTAGKNMKMGTFVCLESTTYPTTTENFVLPIIEEESSFKSEEGFWLAFSPERVDPGNIEFKTKNTPKVLGAISEQGRELGKALYSLAISEIHTVSSPRVAEMVKILENTYRLVNISLINELALLSHRMHINIWEVIDAAKTKPYGFQPFYPGPGVGGHCIPLDPFYLEYIAKGFHFDLTMISAAGQIDNLMPHRMMVRINFALNKHSKSLNNSRILFIGVAYKADIADERESPALKIMDEVARKGGIISYFDPYIKTVRTEKGYSYSSVDFSESLIRKSDCIVITTKHSNVDYKAILENAKLIVDLRNAYENTNPKVFKL